MASKKPACDSPFLHPLPLPDVIHTQAPMLAEPETAPGGRCFCCGAYVKHRFVLDESLPLRQLLESAQDTLTRLSRTSDEVRRLQTMPPPIETLARDKYLKALKAAEKGKLHATLAARRLALRHIPTKEIIDTGELMPTEQTELDAITQPFHLCYICHAWHALNGYAAAQGGMVWLPDLHPRTVVALNRKALKAIFSVIPAHVREGRKVLAELLRHRLPVEDRFNSYRPVDFADALRRFPPSTRGELREKMSGVALILTPESVPDPSLLQ